MNESGRLKLDKGGKIAGFSSMWSLLPDAACHEVTSRNCRNIANIAGELLHIPHVCSFSFLDCMFEGWVAKDYDSQALT